MNPLDAAGYGYLFVGLVTAATIWHFFRHPDSDKAAARRSEFRGGGYPWMVTALCAAAVVAWPVVTIWVVRKARQL